MGLKLYFSHVRNMLEMLRFRIDLKIIVIMPKNEKKTS